jgi:hypothetical protein
MNDASNDPQPRTGSRFWAIAFAMLLLVLGAGALAYNVGVTHGLAESGKLGAQVFPAPPAGSVAVPYAIPYYGWHRPWGFGFLAIPLFFVFWVVVARTIFWRRGYYGRCYGDGFGADGRFDDWHRRAHERMDGPASRP